MRPEDHSADRRCLRASGSETISPATSDRCRGRPVRGSFHWWAQAGGIAGRVGIIVPAFPDGPARVLHAHLVHPPRRPRYRNLPQGGKLPRLRRYWLRYAACSLEPTGGTRMPWNFLSEWLQKRKLRHMLNDRRATRGFRSIAQLENAIAADRTTTERLLAAIGARKSDTADEWTLAPRTP